MVIILMVFVWVIALILCLFSVDDEIPRVCNIKYKYLRKKDWPIELIQSILWLVGL